MLPTAMFVIWLNYYIDMLCRSRFNFFNCWRHLKKNITKILKIPCVDFRRRMDKIFTFLWYSLSFYSIIPGYFSVNVTKQLKCLSFNKLGGHDFYICEDNSKISSFQAFFSLIKLFNWSYIMNGWSDRFKIFSWIHRNIWLQKFQKSYQIYLI